MTPDTTVLNSIDEAARRKFEAAWRQGRPEPIEDLLPRPEDSTYLATLEELIFIEIEFAWKAQAETDPDQSGTLQPTLFASGQHRPPRVEDYLVRFPCLNQPEIVRRLLKQEYLVRHRYGDRPAAGEYRARFPAAILDTRDLDALITFRADSAKSGSMQTSEARVGRYQLCAEYARGGFGLVWRAYDETLGREVAVKQLSGDLAGIADYRQRFVAEACIAAQLQHPGIVPVYDLGGQDGGAPFYTMKLVRGQTFSEAIRRFHEEALTEGERAVEHLRLLNAFLAVTRALAYAHARGVIHRDLKPDNILLGDFGETVILDWGLAKVLRKEAAAPEAAAAPAADPAATQQGTVLGTPVYMAPEQAAGRVDEVDERSDIYALGAILYQILTGKRPFPGTSSEEVLRQVLETEPPAPRSLAPTVPRPLEAICRRAMAKRPADRYAEVGLLTRDLECYLADEPVAAYRATRRERLGRWARRHRTVVASSVVAFVLLIASAVGGLFLWQEKEQERRQQAWENEQQRQQEAREHEQRRRREAAEHLARLRSSAETQERLGRDEVNRSHYGTAEKIFDEALEPLRGQDGVQSLRTRIAAHRDRVHRLNGFYTNAERADRMAFLNRDDEAAADCARAVTSLGVQVNDLKWFNHLAELQLRPDQLEQLREDIYRILILRAAVHFKRGVNHLGESRSREAFQAGKKAAQMVQSFRTSKTAYHIEVFCRALSGESDLPKLALPEPTGAADYYYIGFLHLAYRAIPDDPNIQALLTLGKRIMPAGFDLVTPLVTAERMLRRAATLDPHHFWTHFYLGWTLAGNNRLRAAEQAFNTCLALRPRSGLAFSQRALIVYQQREQCLVSRAQFGGVFAALPAGPFQALPALCFRPGLPDARDLAENPAALKRRILRDLDRAVEFDSREPFVLWLAGNKYYWEGEVPKALACWIRYLDMEQPPAAYRGTQIQKEVTQVTQEVKNSAVWLTDNGWHDAPMWAFRAHAHLVFEEYKEAEEAARHALKLHSDEPRALAVLGLVQLQRKEYASALAAFQRALAKDPNNYLAAAGRARLHEARTENAEALAAYDQYLKIAARNWQRLEAHQGRARILDRLGRRQESRQAREEARRINPYDTW
jgi:tetratricopeptide (TPR) repeat protein